MQFRKTEKFYYTLFFIGYIAPIFYLLLRMWFKGEYFVYENAWDEKTYLSYQGAITTFLTPGYISSVFSLVMHNLGIAPVYQNMFWDIAVPVIMFILLCKIFKISGIPTSRAYFFGVLVVFGSVLFNKSNPLINYLTFLDIPHFIYAMEAYPSILRTPNPQISFLIITFFVFFFIKYKKFLLLLFPIPFLYWSVLIPYCYLLLMYFIKEKYSIKESYKIVVLNISISLILGLAFFAGLSVFKELPSNFGQGQFVELYREWLISPAFLFLGGCYLAVIALLLLFKKSWQKEIHNWIITLMICVIFITNLQVFTGIKLDPKNIQDSSVSLILSLTLVLLIELGFRVNQNSITLQRFMKGTQYGISIILLILVLATQGFDFSALNYRIQTGTKIESRLLEEVQKDPTHAIIPNELAAERVVMTKAKMLVPPLSNQYMYSFFNRACHNYEKMNENAYNFTIESGRYDVTSEEYHYINKNYTTFKQSLKQSANVPYENNNTLCPETSFETFYFVDLNKENTILSFPSWPGFIESGIRLTVGSLLSPLNNFLHGAWTPEIRTYSEPINTGGRNVYLIPSNYNYKEPVISEKYDQHHISYQSNIVKRENDHWFIKGTESKYAYLLKGNHSVKQTEDVFVVKGEIREGILQIGLTKFESWHSSVTINRSGPFTVIIQLSEQGEFTPVIANYQEKDAKKTEFIIDEIGWQETK